MKRPWSKVLRRFVSLMYMLFRSYCVPIWCWTIRKQISVEHLRWTHKWKQIFCQNIVKCRWQVSVKVSYIAQLLKGLTNFNKRKPWLKLWYLIYILDILWAAAVITPHIFGIQHCKIQCLVENQLQHYKVMKQKLHALNFLR